MKKLVKCEVCGEKKDDVTRQIVIRAGEKLASDPACQHCRFAMLDWLDRQPLDWRPNEIEDSSK